MMSLSKNSLWSKGLKKVDKEVILLLFIHCLLFTHSHCVLGFCVESLFCSVALGVLSIVYQSTCRGRESWLLYFHCAVNCCLSVFCVSYSGCHGFVYSL